ncbi:MAG TPA: NUDIX hydrolase [Rugosimonospora sp.]|nr:NUDIX hydrolase [Rugosimonospora sp.]
MTSRPLAFARRRFFDTFYRLPSRWRRRLVRLAGVKYIVGAVTVVWDADAPEPGRLLLLRQPPDRGWSLPAGLLKRNEHPAVGAVRELFEETGVRVAATDVVAMEPWAVVHTSGRWIDLVFEARVPGDVAFAVDGGEVYEAAWHPLDALPKLTGATARLLGFYGIGPLAHPVPGRVAVEDGSD